MIIPPPHLITLMFLTLIPAHLHVCVCVMTTKPHEDNCGFYHLIVCNNIKTL